MTFGERSRRLAAALGLAVVFVAASLAGLALHADLPVGRKAVARLLERLLSDTFLGRFEIVALDQLSLGGLRAREVQVRDPAGRLVLVVSGLRARADIAGIVEDVLFGEGELAVNIQHARAEQAKVVLIPDPASGEPSIAQAFTLAPSKTPSTAPGRPVRVALPAIEIGKGEVRGSVPGVPALDADVFGARGSVLVAPEGVAVDARHFSAVVRGFFKKELRAVGSFHQRGTTRFWTNLDGFIGELQVDSVARLDGKHLKASLDVPRADPDVMRVFLEDWPLLESAAVHAEVEGDLPELGITANAALAAAALDARGKLRLGNEPKLALDITGRHLDLRAVVAESPPTDLEARAKLALTSRASGTEVEIEGNTEPSVVASVPVPAAHFRARYDGKDVEGTAELREEGMPLAAKVKVQPGGVVDVSVEIPRFRLERAPRLARLGIRGTVEIHGKGHLEHRLLDASASAEFEGLAHDVWALGRGRLEARARGPLGEPHKFQLDARVGAERAKFGVLSAGKLDARAEGSLGNLALDVKLGDAGGVSVAAKTRLSAVQGTRFDDVDLSLSRDAVTIHASAARVDLSDRGVEVVGARLDGGAGNLTASGRYRPGLLELSARGDGVDLDTIGKVIGVEKQRLSGKLDVDVELTVARDVRRGHAHLALSDAAFASQRGLELQVLADLDGDSVTGETMARVAGYGSLRSSFELTAEGSLLEAQTWRRVTGRWDFGLERLELERVRPYLPASLGIEELAGGLIAQLTVLRPEPESPPSLNLLAATDGLGLALKTENPEQPLRVSGVELQVGGSVDAASGVAEASVRLVDAHGLLASGSGRGELDWKNVLGERRAVLRGFQDRPLAVTLVVEGRPLDELPALVRPSGVSGVLRAEASLRGTLREPVVAVKASLAGFSVGAADAGEPFDVCGRAQYDPSADRIGLGVEVYVPSAVACRGQRVAVANAAGEIDFAALARGERGFWGDAQLALEGLPLARLGPFVRAGMVGRADGRVALSGTTDPPQLSGELKLLDGSIRGMPIGTGELSLRTDGRDGRVSVKLTRGDGLLEGEARAGVNFERLVPRIDDQRPAFVNATLTNVDAGVLEPVIGDVLSDLGGRLDGSVRAALTPRDPSVAGSGFGGQLQGKLSMLSGTFQIAGLGMRLTDVKFEAETQRLGKQTVVSLRNLSAASRSKYPNVAASADLYLDGVELVGGRGNANLRKVPLMIGGVSQASLTGSASFELKRHADLMRVVIRLPELTADVPRSSGGDVLAVDDHPDIEILQPIAEQRVARGGESLRWELLFDLGKKVRVVRGDVQIPLAGQATVALGERVKVGGDLELKPGGRVQLLGKSFVIETGEVHFDTDDASNPHIRVLASWRAPDATTVWVEVRGTLREATLRLESDPVLSQADIQGLLLGGGTSDAEDGTGSKIGYGTNVGGELFGDSPFRRLEVRVSAETGERAHATATAAVPLSDTLWLEGSYTKANSNDVGEEDASVSTTVEWRFRQNWSLRTQVGTIGAGLDLLYQYRY
ncbi:MAG TPA: translocation/assembly module TamB domain-containing protein [Polyangiaceae bacterium]